MLQARAPAGMKGRLVAISNVLTFTAVLAAAAIPWFLTSIVGLTIRQVILFVALLTLAGTIYVVRMLPDFLVRLVVWLTANSLYRIHTVGEVDLTRFRRRCWGKRKKEFPHAKNPSTICAGIPAPNHRAGARRT
jgi:hypothetical protein